MERRAEYGRHGFGEAVSREDDRAALLERRRRDGERDGAGFYTQPPPAAKILSPLAELLKKASLVLWPAKDGETIVAKADARAARIVRKP